MTTQRLRTFVNRSPLRLGLPRVQTIWIIRGFLFIPLALACFALSPTARAVTPAPDGGYPGGNTAEGTNALFRLTTGFSNTAIGDSALYSNKTGSNNTANGAAALYSNRSGSYNTANGVTALKGNTTGSFNTANGAGALFTNTTGHDNTATGMDALEHSSTGSNNTANGVEALSNNNGNNNTANGYEALLGQLDINGFPVSTGSNNTANGYRALYSYTTGHDNVANGYQALYFNTIGDNNTANGSGALEHSSTGSNNTATGVQALFSNTAGSSNTAIGENALYNSTGSGNIAVGLNAGTGVSTGNGNIDIGNVVMADESNKIRIGTVGEQNATFVAGIYNVNEGGTIKAVYINSNGQLGTQAPASSRRFKKEIKPMDQTSEAVLALKPVTFQYKSDPAGAGPQFGLIAEEVAKVNPDLVVRDENGEIYTVRYEAVNAMLLNEFLKEHRAFLKEQRKVEVQEVTIAQLTQDFQSKLAEQQKQIKALTSGLEKVSAYLEMSRSAPRTVLNNQ